MDNKATKIGKRLWSDLLHDYEDGEIFKPTPHHLQKKNVHFG